MLDTSHSTIQHSELVKIWAARYMPDLATIPFYLRKVVVTRLSEAIATTNRQTMADSILKNLVTDCAFAGIEAQKICLQVGEGLNISEAKSLGLHIAAIYEKLLFLYVEDFVFAPVLDCIYDLDTPQGKLNAATKILPGFNRLSQDIEPLLQQLQSLYLNSSNRRAIGFLTTQLHMTRQNVLGRLNAYGKMWLSSYFQLVEEQVCMPWRRICTAALRPEASTTALSMVQQMFPRSQAIAEKVYQKAMMEFPHHISRQGRIQTLGVQVSSTRDLNMFQAYIWLCVLEGNLSVIEGELLPLCLLVFPSVGVKWMFVECGILWLVQEIQSYLNPEQLRVFDSYAQGIQTLFSNANPKAVDVEAINYSMQMAALRL